MEKSIIIEQEYPYSPEEVWDALTDQAEISDWLMHGTFEPRIGAEFEFYWSGTDGANGATRGKVIELVKPKKLSYTWDWGSSGTLVTFFLEPTTNGTKLRLEHTGFTADKDEHVYQGAMYGWKGNLPKISATIAKRQKSAA